jgi:hypothetical protein
MAVGFVSSLAVSSVYSVAFALAGLCAGVLFGVGISYAIVGGGILLSAWSAYAGGVIGFLTVFPEYATAAMLALPLIKRMSPEEHAGVADAQNGKEAEDMVMATALSYRNSAMSFFSDTEDALAKIAKTLRVIGESDAKIELSEYRDSAIESVKSFCRDCPGYSACLLESPAPCVENIEAIARKLYRKERIFGDEVTVAPKYCHNAVALFEAVSRGAASLEEERYKNRKIETIAEECELFSKLIEEVRTSAEKERTQNSRLTERLTEIFDSAGIGKGLADGKIGGLFER